MGESVSIQERLRLVQVELKAPKSQRNTFGNYNYRNAEDILEAAKPLCAANGLTLVVGDSIELIGERYYVRATATVWDDKNDRISVNAYAREAEEKKGMDSAQVTGATSSYARKYALNGLFAIDDTKDADTDEHRNQSETRTSGDSNPKPAASPNKPASAKQINLIKQLAKKADIPEEQVAVRLMEIETAKDASDAIKKLQALIGDEPQERTWK